MVGYWGWAGYGKLNQEGAGFWLFENETLVQRKIPAIIWLWDS